jgi:hypothetical protein
VFYRFEDSIYLSGIPASRRRDWLANLAAQPRFVFHLKHGVAADLPAVATVITDPAERRRVLTRFVEEFKSKSSMSATGKAADGPAPSWTTGCKTAR